MTTMIAVKRGAAIWLGCLVVWGGFGMMRGEGLREALAAGMSAGLVIGGAAIILSEVFGALIDVAERLTGLDINRDGAVAGGFGRIVINGRKQEPAETEQERFRHFVFGCSVPRQTTLDFWQAKGWSEEEWSGMRDFLIQSGHAVWNNAERRQMGWRLSQEPESIMEQVRTWKG
jgi:hypothetical protein